MNVPVKPQPDARSSYKAFRAISTRWMDNDVYGHVNNVVYYSWFDTAVNATLIEKGVLDIHTGLEKGRVRLGGLMQGVVFPSPGWSRDFYWSSMGQLARVFIT